MKLALVIPGVVAVFAGAVGGLAFANWRWVTPQE
jgi:hypothetical protein